MPDRLLSMDGGDFEDGGSEGSAPQELRAAVWLEESWPRLLAYAQKTTMRAIAVHYDAEDVLQEAIVRALKNPESLKGLRNVNAFERWMKRVIQNRVLDLRRMISVREDVWPAQTSGGDEPDGDWDQLAGIPGRMSPEQTSFVTARQGYGDVVARELRPLSFEEHISVLMRDVLLMNWCAISATLGRTTNGAKSLRHRARGRFL